MMSLGKYVGLSALAAGAVVYHAFATKEQFFPSVHSLATSKVAIAAISNFSFALLLCVYKLMTKMFLGTLREAEVERINERMSQAIMETCLAMTMFREEFNVEFAAMFALLTFVKVCHWLVQDRVDYMETTPTVSRLTHARILTFMALLLTLDSAFLQFAISRLVKRSGTVHLLFAFEYVILASIVMSVFLKHMLSAIDNYLEGRWEQKGVYVFYLELITDMIHLIIYIVFFVIVFVNHGLPLHLVRDLYWTFRNFRNRVADFLRYRRVTANMDERFADATAEDLVRCDGVCIICREEMNLATARAKRLGCGHVFHVHCLRSWLERQQNCPICRTSVFAPLPEDAAAQAAAAAPDAAAPAPPPHDGVHADPAAVVHAPAEVAAGQAGLRQRVWGAPPQAPAGAAAEPAPAPAHFAHVEAHMAGYPHGAHVAAPGVARVGGQAPAGAMPGLWPAANYGIMWNMPQWAPTTSMALYLPAAHVPLQYAGQQGPEVPGVPGSQSMAVPLLPLVVPQALLNPVPPLGPGATPQQHEQQQQQAAAAAAAAAFNGMMVPPSILAHGVSAPAPGAPGSVAYTAMNAAAAAYVAAQHSMSMAGNPQGAAPTSTEELEVFLRRQLDALHTQIATLQRDRERAGGAPATATPASVAKADAGDKTAAGEGNAAEAPVGVSDEASDVDGASPGESAEPTEAAASSLPSGP